MRVEEDGLVLPYGGGAKPRGEAWTPRHVAALLCKWAIRSAEDMVLDPGSGRGIFLFEAYRRMLELGATPSTARMNLFGIEKDPGSYRAMCENLTPLFGGRMPNIRHGDLFEATFPSMDAVIGNPPYVRRWWLKDVGVLQERIRERIGEIELTRLTDLACYFIIYAADFLKPGGRLALVVTDGWMDAEYGKAFKRYLLSNFRLHALVAFESRVFENLLVRPVLLLAEKRDGSAKGASRGRTLFALLSRTGLELKGRKQITLRQFEQAAVRSTVRDETELRPEEAWTPYFTAPQVYFHLSAQTISVPLGELAASRIGLQTFAKPFFILKPDQLRALGLDEHHFRPIAVSSRDIRRPILVATDGPQNFLLCCDSTTNELKGTSLLHYIQDWEKRELTPRGSADKVIGVQNLPRLRRAGRVPWYNLWDEVRRRGSWPILLPRRIFRRYLAAWNVAGWVANENFIELSPREDVLLEPFLAVLNSSFAELSLRVNAHLYGGGVYNLNPGNVGAVPLLDLRGLDIQGIKALRAAYEEFRRDGMRRAKLDAAVFRAFRVSPDLRAEVVAALAELQEASLSIKSAGGARHLPSLV
ncbi:MAG: N-6 DNA methylase [candidate division NC10 bacterium]|nr:N-6 DNA methylase [candidate division NC10 bacterium]